MMTVTPDQLAEILAGIKGAKPIGLTALTTIEATKHSPFGELRKLARYNAFTGCNYRTMIETQRHTQGQPHPSPFQVQPHSWAERAGPALYVHPETHRPYLAAYLLRPTSRPVYFYQRSAGFWAPIEQAKVAEFLPKDRKAETAAHQGLIEPVKFRNFKMESLVSLSLDHHKYRVRRPIEEAADALPFP